MEDQQQASLTASSDTADTVITSQNRRDGRPFTVITGEFFHETYTFSKVPTTIRSFDERTVYYGEEAIAQRGKATTTELAGFLECRDRFGWNMIHSVSAFATPAGLVTSEAFETFVTAITDVIKQHVSGDGRVTGGVDGVLLALHGAMVTDTYDDGDGEILRRVRAVVGCDIPIAVTLDLHANVSQAMTDAANIIVSYKTYPHIDMKETGEHAGRLLQDAMAGKTKPVTMRAVRPMVEEANSGRTDVGPMIERLQRIRDYEAEPRNGALAVSINAGFPTDINSYVGPTVLCTYDSLVNTELGNASKHRDFIESLADDIWNRRHDVLNTFLSVSEASCIAGDFLKRKHHSSNDGTRLKSGPLVIADYADNPGAGSYGDATALLTALLSYKGTDDDNSTVQITNAAFVPIVDPEAVQYIFDHYNAGDVITRDRPIVYGGKVDPRFGGDPLTATAGTVLTLSEDGVFTGTGPMIGGLTLSFGKTAVIRVDDRIDVLLVSDAHQILDLSQLITFGIDPCSKDVIVVKSMQHFRAVFEPIASKIIVADSGALATPDMRKLIFEKVPRPIYPLDLE
jgi:microcystin degradation protein MlrC